MLHIMLEASYKSRQVILPNDEQQPTAEAAPCSSSPVKSGSWTKNAWTKHRRTIECSCSLHNVRALLTQST
jgi:hypothetical protein